MKVRTVAWMIPIAAWFVVGSASEVRAGLAPTRSPAAPLDGIYSISTGGEVWDLEWASLSAGARVFNRAPVAGAQNELFRLTWQFTDTDRGDVYTIEPVHSNLCLTTWPAPPVQNLAQHQCVTDFHRYVDQWSFQRVCGGPCGCALNDCNADLYIITSLQTGGYITEAPGADINNWQPLQVGPTISTFEWTLTKQ
jgi:hypothetical protein